MMRLHSTGGRGVRLVLAALLILAARARHPYAVQAGGPSDPLTFVEAHRDYNLGTAQSVAVSPDGKHVYVALYYVNAVSAFQVNATSGQLSFVGSVVQGRGPVDGLTGASSVVVSPDGNHVYATGAIDDAVVTFARNATSGALTWVQTIYNSDDGVAGLMGASAVAVSPDGNNVYVAGKDNDAIAIFDRDPATGALSFLGWECDGCGGVNGLGGACAVAVTPDGSHVYVAGGLDDALAIFAREAATGSLSYVGREIPPYLNAPCSVAVSPDGNYVYAAALDDAVVALSRNASTGELTYVEAECDGVDGVDGLDGAWGLAISPDGDNVYVSGSWEDALAVFQRSSVTGELTYVETVWDDVNGVDGLNHVMGLAVSPSGEYLYAAGGADQALAAFHRDGTDGTLSLLQVCQSAAGLEGAVGSAVSPDGAHVYVTGNIDNTLVCFARDRASGSLEWAASKSDGRSGVDGLDQARDVAVSPDGAHVYVAGYGDDAVAVFARDAASGDLTWLGMAQDGVGGVAGLAGPQALTISPDGANVYVASSSSGAVTVFERDASTGSLDYMDSLFDGVGGVDGLGGVYAVAVSPDGKHAYAVGYNDDALVSFGRSASGGGLTYLATLWDGVGGVDGLNGANSVAVSPDGGHVYVASRNDDAVAIFSRNSTTGALTYLGMVRDGIGGVDGLNGARAVTVSPDGSQVYVASQVDDALAVFARDPSTGLLAFVKAHKDGVAGVDGLNTADALTVSPDGAHVYVSGYDDNALAVFARYRIYLPLVLRGS